MGAAPGATRRLDTNFDLLVEGNEYLGTAGIRHELTDYLRQYGGHIGYAIRSAQRGKGYGTLICSLALTEARKLELKHVLIARDDDNVRSARIIERNGGVLEDKIPGDERDVPKRRYWVEL